MTSSSEFKSPAEQYDRFMGRYTRALAPALVEASQLPASGRVVDVGCGPGGLTVELARRFGGDHVAAIDPAQQFVAACAERVPGVDAQVGVAEELPWGDNTFDAALSSLVIGFMRDPDQGIAEMVRVTRPGGVVAACMWALPGGLEMLRYYWQAFEEVRPGEGGDRPLAGTGEGDLLGRFQRSGLAGVHGGVLDITAEYTDFDDFWEPLTYAVGPSAQALAALPDDEKLAVREAARELVPSDGPFTLSARAWFARGLVA